jgi:hypothetical protein
MPVNKQLLDTLQIAIATPVQPESLAALLAANSNLPGARANLELVNKVAQASAGRTDLLSLYAHWLQQPTATNDRTEFLALTASTALGAIFNGGNESTRMEVIHLLRMAANDGRWRVREGVSMGLQRIGESNFADLEAILRSWQSSATLLERRAIVAALAHHPILKDPRVAEAALEIAAPIALGVADFDPKTRETQEYKVLLKGLSFALSVLVAATPDRGFALLNELVETGDNDAIAVVRENLQKSRIATPFPGEVSALLEGIARTRL